MRHIQPTFVHAIWLDKIRVAEIDIAKQLGKLAILIVLRRYDNQIWARLVGFPIGLAGFNPGFLCQFTFGEDNAVALFR